MNIEDQVRALLPSNATTLERSVIEAVIKRIGDTPLLFDRIWSPETCPVELLPFLAWATSVDVWDDQWPEAVKRAVIAASPQVHRKKGTVQAVKMALEALGFFTEVSEWWQEVPAARRGTFAVDAYGADVFAAGFQINPKLFATVKNLIENVKPVRAHFTLRVGEKRGGTVTARTGSCAKVVDCRDVTPALPVEVHAPRLSARSGSRAVAVSHQIHTFDMGVPA